jgi:hypothetical protein
MTQSPCRASDRIGEKRNGDSILVWKPARKEPLGESTRRYKDNIKTGSKQMKKEGRGLGLFDLDQGVIQGFFERGNEQSS